MLIDLSDISYALLIKVNLSSEQDEFNQNNLQGIYHRK